MKVKLGIDCLLAGNQLKSKRIGLLTNSSGVNGDLRINVDLLLSNRFNIVKLFGPEHGISGAAADGVSVDNAVDPKYGIPIYSLFGDVIRPTEEMLSGIDSFVYDIQDVGLRFYTYLYSLVYSMEECAKRGIEVVVLDRPNPLSCKVVGPTIKKRLDSIVGGYGLALRYGMTVGEVAKYFNKVFDIGADLIVIPMENYDKDMYYDETGHLWSTPSPNIPSLEHAILYSGFCLFEGTNLSMGRGTVHPFKYIGAPWIDSSLLYKELKKHDHPGIAFRERSFIPGAFKLHDQSCNGLEFYVADRNTIKPLELALDIIATLIRLWPEKFDWDVHYHGTSIPLNKMWDGRYHFDLIMGEERYREELLKGATSAELSRLWEGEQREFESLIEEFRIY
ncbi:MULTISPECIES: exo-beta-N-acetylmuramidase NamZ family protein [unclassified Mesotoga]|uniref:exo-beta-N-acetylmuramidase NamZ family protein n=1 Tax=unclassified Mesotoga TaxID=1184398 RepID=UPI000A77B56D|nr:MULTISPECIES: DUF1343 domain-containing protein [unclassified Mesotoga]